VSILSRDYKPRYSPCLTEGMSIRRTERKRADNPGNKAFMPGMTQSWIQVGPNRQKKRTIRAKERRDLTLS
jgi:hypothetical protein